MLIAGLSETTGNPSVKDLSDAIEDIFEVRGREALFLGLEPRKIPASITAMGHWQSDYQRAAQSSGLDLSMEEAVNEINSMLAKLTQTHEERLG